MTFGRCNSYEKSGRTIICREGLHIFWHLFKKKEKKISVGQTLVITIYWSYLSLYVHSCHYPRTKIIGIDLACSASWQGGVGIDVGDTMLKKNRANQIISLISSWPSSIYLLWCTYTHIGTLIAPSTFVACCNRIFVSRAPNSRTFDRVESQNIKKTSACAKQKVEEILFEMNSQYTRSCFETALFPFAPTTRF